MHTSYGYELENQAEELKLYCLIWEKIFILALLRWHKSAKRNVKNNTSAMMRSPVGTPCLALRCFNCVSGVVCACGCGLSSWDFYQTFLLSKQKMTLGHHTCWDSHPRARMLSRTHTNETAVRVGLVISSACFFFRLRKVALRCNSQCVFESERAHHVDQFSVSTRRWD